MLAGNKAYTKGMLQCVKEDQLWQQLQKEVDEVDTSQLHTIPSGTRWRWVREYLARHKNRVWFAIANTFHIFFFMPANKFVLGCGPHAVFLLREKLGEWDRQLEQMQSLAWWRQALGDTTKQAWWEEPDWGAVVCGVRLFHKGLVERTSRWRKNPLYMLPALCGPEPLEAAASILQHKTSCTPRAMEVHEVLSEPEFWDNAKQAVRDGNIDLLERWQKLIYKEWYGLPLHTELAEQCMSVLHKHIIRALNADLPHHERFVRRTKKPTRLDADMVEPGGVAYDFWEEAREEYKRVKCEDGKRLSAV